MNLTNQANRANKYDWYNQKKFDQYFQKLKNDAKSGNVDKMMGVARLYQDGLINYDLFQRKDIVNLSPNYSKALKWYRKAAEHNHLEALTIIGDNEFSQKNYQAAFTHFQKGANMGDGYCLKKLGDIYRQRNHSDKALSCYLSALKKGQLFAISGLFCLKVCG